ncbi:hypothetical protein BDY19DRAFT_290007 [Irpex rosettiformis]|uniref:Uncharacterized protein n=1 Tax=Irpex rosettiformis TaxID=378272 RepID=A0ACB8UHY6_9APHY|nr:hypothetical protein BDY19DRAFT_290007 [Irpex rosettiformis]
MSAGAALYSQAMSTVSRNPSTNSSALSSPPPTAKRTNASYMTADEEKAALRRYYDAKAAVSRTQGSAYDPIPEASNSSPAPTSISSPAPAPAASPISYNALYPNTNSPKPVNTPPPPGPGELPPAFSPGTDGQPQYLSEKEKLRRAYEERDAAALAARSPSPPTFNGPTPTNGPLFGSAPPDYVPSPPPFAQTQLNGVANALSEKEILRRRFEQQDAAALAARPPPPTTPPRSVDGHGGRALPTPRAQPTPPGSAHGARVLSAAEEKARLRAMYEAEEREASMGSAPPASPPGYVNGANRLNGANVTRNGSVSSVGLDYSRIPPPPPLAPRPPKEYIHETQEEDQKIAAQIQAIDKETDVGSPDSSSRVCLSLEHPLPYPSYSNPVTISSPQPRPPLPPKFGLDDP